MNTHHISLYHEKTNPVPAKVLKQELVTWEETEAGIRLARLTRSFGPNGHYDAFESQQVVHSQLL